MCELALPLAVLTHSTETSECVRGICPVVVRCDCNSAACVGASSGDSDMGSGIACEQDSAVVALEDEVVVETGAGAVCVGESVDGAYSDASTGVDNAEWTSRTKEEDETEEAEETEHMSDTWRHSYQTMQAGNDGGTEVDAEGVAVEKMGTRVAILEASLPDMMISC